MEFIDVFRHHFLPISQRMVFLGTSYLLQYLACKFSESDKKSMLFCTKDINTTVFIFLLFFDLHIG